MAERKTSGRSCLCPQEDVEFGMESGERGRVQSVNTNREQAASWSGHQNKLRQQGRAEAAKALTLLTARLRGKPRSCKGGLCHGCSPAAGLRRTVPGRKPPTSWELQVCLERLKAGLPRIRQPARGSAAPG
eukprot:751711-Hanusia_phi.AAC.9